MLRETGGKKAERARGEEMRECPTHARGGLRIEHITIKLEYRSTKSTKYPHKPALQHGTNPYVRAARCKKGRHSLAHLNAGTGSFAC